MMRIAYLMLVHKNPQLQKRAVETLTSDHSAFFIHIDRKADIRQFSSISGDNIFFAEHRIPVYWGEFSQVEATMLLVRQALASCVNYDYLVFSTGSDYPIRSGRYIQKFFEENRGSEFISLVRIPAPGYPLSKINRLRYPSSKPIRRFALRTLAKLGLAQRDYRKHIGSVVAYAGHGSWALSGSACQYIVEEMTLKPYLEVYFRTTFTSDEMFFHTILGNSPFRPRIRRSLVYVDWSAPGRHPALLTERHVRSFETLDKVSVEDEWGCGEMLFARKFSDENLELLDRVDEMIRRKEGRSDA